MCAPGEWRDAKKRRSALVQSGAPGARTTARMVVHGSGLGGLVGTSRRRPPAHRYGSARVGFLVRSAESIKGPSGATNTWRARLLREQCGP